MGVKAKPVAERFWPKVKKSDGCWEWMAGKDKLGYGSIGPDRNSTAGRLAHRVSWEIANGPIPAGMLIDHICHNPGCVRPDHLRLATQKQNMENRPKPPRTNKTGVLGVSWDESSKVKKFRATVTHNYRHYYVGRFHTLEEAAEAVHLKRLELFTHNQLDR